MNELMSSLFNLEPLYVLWQFDGPAYLVTVLIVFIIAKLLYDLFTPYKLNEQLTDVDNKAVAVSFAGYLVGIGIVLHGVITSPVAGNEVIASSTDLYKDLFDTVIWSAIGILLLNVARIVNDNVLLNKFDNVKELVEDKNIGTGAVEWGSYIGSALIIESVIFGESGGFWNDVIATVFYFALGQFGFIIFGWLYQKLSRFDLHAEIEKDNISAGVAYGSSLVAIAILLSGYIMRYDSLLGFVIWFVLSVFFLVVSRYIVDKFIIPGSLLDEEISKDQNWGAALIEGGMAIVLALLLVPAFL